jgi:hypothetical protein
MRSHLRLLCLFMLALGLCHVQLHAQHPVSWSTLGPERTFPSDSGMINVKAVYHAAGDGVTDDTAAIQAAISAQIRKQTTSRIITFLPALTASQNRLFGKTLPVLLMPS